MKNLILALLLSHAPVYANEQLPCPPQSASEPLLYMSEFSWGQNLEQMGAKFKEVYQSGKRLKGRAYLDSRGNYVVRMGEGFVPVPVRFIGAVRRHIEISLERRYADFIFFPDMGHSHFFMPESEWDRVTAPSEQFRIYTNLLALPSLKVLYHTAEQLRVREGERGQGAYPQDETLLWRYFSRNPVGDVITGENVAPYFAFENKSYNTLHELKGHRSWSAGFSVSASKDGCFRYTGTDGKEYRFDLSLEDLPYSPGGGEGGDMLRAWKAH